MTRVTTWEGVEYLVVTKVFCNIALASLGYTGSGNHIVKFEAEALLSSTIMSIHQVIEMYFLDP